MRHIRMAAFAVMGTVALGAQVRAQSENALDAKAAEQRLRSYVQVWESDERIGPAAMRAYYADRVTYYGKSMSREEVLADKLRFIRAHPRRSYDIVPGSLRTRCDAGKCAARAVLIWRRETRDGHARSGASALTLVFSADAGGRIVRESARTLRGRR